ncbi:MAG: hypothetical protein DWQ02_04370 [Bacteroidetes bacterium]|nr:MAG: hypothetical protein DWQ02_04370 [Bacteroidota bacterium]
MEAGPIFNRTFLGFSGSIKYQVGSFDFETRYDRTFKGTPELLQGYSFGQNKDFIEIRENRWNSKNSFGFWANYTPNFKYFKPIFGLGYTFDFFPSTTYDYYDEHGNVLLKINDDSWPQSGLQKGFSYKIGYGFKNYRFYLILHSLARSIDSRGSLTLNLSYNFRVSKNKTTEPSIINPDKTKYQNPILFSLTYGFSFEYPLSKVYNAYALKPFIESKVKIGEHLYTGLHFTFGNSNYQPNIHDKSTLQITPTDSISLLVTYTKIAQETSRVIIFLEKELTHSNNSSILLGGGFGYFFSKETDGFLMNFSPIHYQSTSSPIYYQHPKIKVFKNRGFVGLNLRGGFRTGPFSNKIILNIPFGKLPSTFEFHSAININLRE